jgi:replicative DNA helicase
VIAVMPERATWDDLDTVPADDAARREAPYDTDAERVVLGSLMANPAAVVDVARMLRPDDFYQPAHRRIYETVLDLDSRRLPTDPVTVGEHLAGDLSRVGGAPYLHTCYASVLSSAGSPTHFAGIVAGKAILRKLEQASDRIRQLAQAAAHNAAAETLDRARALLADIDAPLTEDGPVVWRDILPVTLDAIQADGDAEKPVGVISTGITDLDRILGGGYRRSEFVVLAGRPGMGKTVHAMDVARAVSFNNRDRRMPVFSLEMSQDELARRLISAQARVPLDLVRTGHLGDDDWTRIARMAGDTEDAPLHVDVTPTLTMADIRSRARRVRRREGDLQVVIIDFIQLLTAAKGTGRETREQQVAAMSRAGKLLAKELDALVIAVAQLNRGPEQRADKRPQLSDLRESGSLEQDANVVILLHRDDYYDKESPRSGEVDLIVAKNRGGPTDTITCAAQLHLARFVDMAVI